jgi:hypothetical protein
MQYPIRISSRIAHVVGVVGAPPLLSWEACIRGYSNPTPSWDTILTYISLALTENPLMYAKFGFYTSHFDPFPYTAVHVEYTAHSVKSAQKCAQQYKCSSEND